MLSQRQGWAHWDSPWDGWCRLTPSRHPTAWCGSRGDSARRGSCSWRCFGATPGPSLPERGCAGSWGAVTETGLRVMDLEFGLGSWCRGLSMSRDQFFSRIDLWSWWIKCSTWSNLLRPHSCSWRRRCSSRWLFELLSFDCCLRFAGLIGGLCPVCHLFGRFGQLIPWKHHWNWVSPSLDAMGQLSFQCCSQIFLANYASLVHHVTHYGPDLWTKLPLQGCMKPGHFGRAGWKAEFLVLVACSLSERCRWARLHGRFGIGFGIIA